jgi:hypothetical protein
MKQVAKTLRRHSERLIAALKGTARGLKNFANFPTRVLVYPGKPDRYPASSRHGNPGRMRKFSRRSSLAAGSRQVWRYGLDPMALQIIFRFIFT